MPFFQNVFAEDFEANLLLADRHHIPKFVVKGNRGRSQELVVSWNKGPYALDGTDADGNSSALLSITYCLHHNKNWATLNIDVTANAVNPAAVTAQEVIVDLNDNNIFNDYFVANAIEKFDTGEPRIEIKQKRSVTDFRFYINNGGAEEKIRFNARAGVGELPSFFARHTIDNRFNYDNAQNHLIQLDSTGIDADIINNAVDHKGISLGLDATAAQADWQLMKGKSGLFIFTKGPSGGVVATTETVITYSAGSIAGDMGMKTVTELDSTGDVVAKYEIPHTLDATDLVTPP